MEKLLLIDVGFRQSLPRSAEDYHIRSNLKKNFNKLGTREAELKYTKQRNKCVSLQEKAINVCFKKAAERVRSQTGIFGI